MMRRGKFEKFHRDHKRDLDPVVRRYYFRLVAGNGEIIAQSEGYTTAAMRDKGIRSVRRNAMFAKVVDANSP